MTNKMLINGLAVSAAAVLVGCGGGGGSSSAPTASPAPQASTLTGVATDDLILNGIVTATNENNQILATGRTSQTDGSYTLKVEDDGIVFVQVGCDENATMYNPETNTSVACGNDIVLHSVADVKAGSEVTVNISPLSNIVYERVQELAQDGLNTEDVEQARSEISQMFAVDPIADNPVEDNTYKKVINAIHVLATEENTSVIEVTDRLAEALKDGAADGEESVVALVDVMQEQNITNNLVENNATFAPVDAQLLSDVEAAKAFFDELRTQAMSVVDYQESGTPGFLDNEAVSMEQALQGTAINLGYVGEVFGRMADGIGTIERNSMSEISGSFDGNKTATLTKTSPGAYSYKIEDDANTWEGRISLPAEILGDNAEAELYSSGTLTLEISGTLPLNIEGLSSDIEDSQSFNGTLKVTKNSTGADIELSGSVASNGTELKIVKATATAGYHAVTDQNEMETIFDYIKLNELTLQGKVGVYTIDGSLKVNDYVQNDSLKDKGGFEEISYGGFYGQVSCLHSAVTRAKIYFVDDAGTQYLPTYSDLSYEYMFGFDDLPVNLDYSILESHIQSSVVCQDENDTYDISIFNSWGYTEEELANSGWLPSDLSFVGKIARTDASLEGTLNAKWLNAKTQVMGSVMESPADPKLDVRFNGTLQMPSRPQMLTTLTYKNDLDATGETTTQYIGASYQYDSTLVNLSATMDADMKEGNVTVKNGTGLEVDITIKEGNIDTTQSKVTQDGREIGAFEEREGTPVIKYENGEFESLY